MSGYIGVQPVPQATQTRDTFTATAGQTSFATSGYTPNFLDVFLNGVHLVNGTDYTATNGSDVVLTSGAALDDNLEVVAYTTFQTGDFVPTSGGTFSGNVAVNGNLTVDTNTLFVDAASNNVGIGTSSPGARLEVAGETRIYPSSGSAVIRFGSGGVEKGKIDVQSTSNMLFETAGTERMRIDASGNLLVGTTSGGGKVRVDFAGLTSVGVSIRDTDATGTTQAFTFFKNNTQVGSITTSTTATAYNTSSDYRLKEDVQPMVGASDRLMALKPVNFAWKVDGSRVDGFLAHEAQEVVPEAVTGSKDAVDKDGKPEYQGIDQSKIVPLLTAALQEALTEIAQLKADVAALRET